MRTRQFLFIDVFHWEGKKAIRGLRKGKTNPCLPIHRNASVTEILDTVENKPALETTGRIKSNVMHCYKTFRRIPPPSPDDAGLILLGRGKRLLYMGREFAPSGTEVFRNHRKFPAIFTMKKGRMHMMGSNSAPLEYYSCPLPLDHGYNVLNVKK
jgi:hypothetical protein